MILIKELEDPRRFDAAPVGDVPEIVQDSIGRGPVEPGAAPRPEQSRLRGQKWAVALRPFQPGTFGGALAMMDSMVMLFSSIRLVAV